MPNRKHKTHTKLVSLLERLVFGAEGFIKGDLGGAWAVVDLEGEDLVGVSAVLKQDGGQVERPVAAAFHLVQPLEADVSKARRLGLALLLVLLQHTLQ